MTTAMIGVDTHIVDYLLTANTTDVSNETDYPLMKEKVTIQSLWLSPYCMLCVAPTVWKEVLRIPRSRAGTLPGMPLKEQAVGTLILLFHEILRLDAQAVDRRARYYNQFHKDLDDCYLIAESEEAALDVVLTYDKALLKHLKQRANIPIMTPTEYEDCPN